MTKQQKRLGRGLSALISVPAEPPSASPDADSPARAPAGPASLPVEAIRPNPFQPRQHSRPEDLKSLAESIRRTGVVQPVVVRPTADGAYELLAGERRWRASQIAGLSVIPAVVREASDEQVLEIALVENIFREDLNAIDRAAAYRRYGDEFRLTADEVASRLGEDRSTVANYLRLLELPPEVKEWVAEGKLAMGHARCLLGLKSATELVQAAKQAIERALSVRAVEKLVAERVRARQAASRAAPAADGKRPQIRTLEEAFIRTLGTKVEIHESRRKGTGKVVIHYYSLDDFDRVAERLGVDTNQ